MRACTFRSLPTLEEEVHAREGEVEKVREAQEVGGVDRLCCCRCCFVDG